MRAAVGEGHLRKRRAAVFGLLMVCLAGVRAASSIAAPAAAPGATFTNPLFAGGDPWVTRVDGVYYYSASQCGVAAICLKHSRSLSGLARAPWVGVWNPPHEKGSNSRQIWAPEVHHLAGRWYIYYAADDGDNDHHRLYVLDSNRAAGPYREAETGYPHGRLADASGDWAIDPDVFTAADGHLYLTWSCTNYRDGRFPQRICLARMRDPLHVTGSTVRLATPTEPWEMRGKPIQEGPVGYTRDGRTYITYSASAAWMADAYAVGLLTLAPGASPMSPAAWTKSGPIFDHHGKVYGPGSVVFVQSPDGRQWWNMYHAIDRLDCKPAYRCRDIRMQPMRFDAQGAPVLGVPVNPGVPLPLPSGDRTAAHHPGRWSTVWGTAMLRSPVPAGAVRPSVLAAPRLTGQTLRQMVVLSAGGPRIRIRLSNAFGRRALRIDAASVGRQARGGSDGQLAADTVRALRFAGKPGVVIPPGGVRYSDPLDTVVHAGGILGVSLYVAGKETPSTWHPDARWHNLISTHGNYTATPVMPVAAVTGSTMWLWGVDVQADEPLPVLVALGDSITNGYRSTVDRADSYPQQLARRLRDRNPACRLAVVDAGIDGNEMSARNGGYGPGDSMRRRFGRDVLDQSGVRDVILLGGVNDIGETTTALRARGRALDEGAARTIAKNVIAAQSKVIREAHRAGLRIFGATILPFQGTQGAYSLAGEHARQQINDWIRYHAPFDGVIDFDAAMRDPADPARLRPDLDSGDHIHPNDKGYGVMAAAVPAALLGCRR